MLRQVKASREEQASGSGLSSVATLPLGAGRTLHVVRAGDEVLLLGVSEHQVTRLGSWSQSEAEAAGLLTGAHDTRPDPVSATPFESGSPGPTLRQLLDAVRKRTVRR